MKEKQRIAILYAVLAAALYALAIPFSKIALKETPPAMTAALLYLGAGTGMALTGWIRKQRKISWKEAPLTRKDTPYIVGMVALDIAAPILLMLGLTWATAAEASLLNNFEIVATAVFALWLFGEKVSCRLWTAIGLITLASMLLAANSTDHFSFSPGALLVLAAAACWGLENNCTRKLSAKDPLEIVVIKGLGSGLGSLAIALSHRRSIPGGKDAAGHSLAGIRRVRIEHLLLRVRPALHRRRPNECLLCARPFHRCFPVVSPAGRAPQGKLFPRSGSDDPRDIPGNRQARINRLLPLSHRSL